MLSTGGTDWNSTSLRAWGACLVAGLLAAIILVGPLIGAKLALPDENDVPTYMGRGGLKLLDVPRVVIEKTEVGEFGQSQRMRPVYYFGRVAETAMWGYDAAKWYALRVGMFACVVATLLWIFTRYAGMGLGVGLTILTLSYPMWTDIWARSTGPSEQLAMLGTAIFAIGVIQFIHGWKKDLSLRGSCDAASLGAFISMGSKENMLFLQVPLIGAIAAMLWDRRRADKVGIAVLLLAVGMGAWVGSSIVVYFSANKVQDIYGSSPSLAIIWPRRLSLFAVAIGAVSYLGVTWWVDREIAHRRGSAAQIEFRRVALLFFTSVFAIGVFFVAQFFFYSGRIPSSGRYDFPALLAVPALIIVCTWAWGRTAEILFGWRNATHVLRNAAAALAVIYAVVFPTKLPAAVAKRVQETNVFETGVLQSREMARRHPDWPIVIRSYDPWDYEVVQTIGVVFLAREFENPLYMVHKPPTSKPLTAFEAKSLSDVLIDQSRKGYAARGLRPIGELKDPTMSECFAVILANSETFQADRRSPEAPLEGLNCRPMPLSLYWSNGKLIFYLYPVHKSPND